jgi:glycosyltransferase involved in cell wall biosynthesis
MRSAAERIVIVTPGGVEGGGGMGRMMGYVVDELGARGLGGEVVVLDPRGAGSVWLSPFYLLLACLRLTAMLLAGRVALMHVNTSERMSFPRKGVIVHLARLFRVPVIAHMHGADFLPFFDGADRLQRWWVRRTLRLCQQVLVLGEHYREHLIRAVGLEPGRILRLYNAIPDMTPAAAGRDRETPPALLLLANISARKGADTLLEAAAMLRDQGQPFHLTLAGGGEVEAFQAEAKRLGLDGRTTFPGWVDREAAHDLLRRADIMLLPSRAEGLPIAILEALALGTPTVTTPVGAIPEVLEDGVHALLVEPGDAAGLARAIERLLTGKVDPETLSRNGRALYQQEFAIGRYCDRLIEIYRTVITSSGRQPPRWAKTEQQLAA